MTTRKANTTRTFEVFRHGVKVGTFEGTAATAATLVRKLYGRSQSLVWVDAQASPREREEARIKSGNIWDRQASRIGRPRLRSAVDLDDDVINAFKTSGPGWQSRIRGVLADYVKKNLTKR